ncbi:replication-associated recombination protein A [Candidatus Berkelbacteria bacterium]|nr:replication-associated recombination protein A [Candidatus Berkelbacteria bacterium]
MSPKRLRRQDQDIQPPLAERLRPERLRAVVGQDHLIGPGKPLTKFLKSGRMPSLLFWGPPGTGKTTLARVIARELDRPFEALTAVDATVKDVRRIIEAAGVRRRLEEATPILFIDEIHRFNTAQQDALLHAVEEGTITLVGATTENPSFKVNAPLLSRLRVFTLKPLEHRALHELIRRALTLYPEHQSTREATEYLIAAADGDARTLLGSLEVACELGLRIDLETAREAVQRKVVRYDQAGEEHYNTISAFIKSLRGSDANAALHYLARMIEAGEDPVFIARRMVVFASEDVGNALPTALVVATATMTAAHMIGYPEARIVLAQCATYLASAPKNRAAYTGIERALHDVRELTLEPIPLHLRNAVTTFMEEQGYGQKEEGMPDFLPKSLANVRYYEPPISKH